MNETILYNVWHENAYHTLALLYFFLGGMGAGSFIISALSKKIATERYKSFVNIGAVAALVLISVGGLCLLFDLEQPLRAFYLAMIFNVKSPISWGGIIITGFAVTTVVYNYLLFFVKDDKKTQICATVGICFAIILASYTGLVLAMAKARPLWHSAVIPPLFLVSSCISGMALLLLIVNVFKKYQPEPDVIHRMEVILAVLIVFEIFLLGDMSIVYLRIATAHEKALLLLVGKFAFLYWAIALCLGLILHDLILFRKKMAQNRALQIITSVLVLVEVFLLRYIILILGQEFPLS